MKTEHKIRYTAGPMMLAILFVLLLLPPLSAKAKDTSDGPQVVSTGLYVLAEQSSMAMAAVKGNSIYFEPADFARALDLPVSGIEEITFTSVPPASDGELLVGSTVLNKGQTLSYASLSLLSYEASSDISVSSFTFRVGDSPLDMTCKLYMLDKANACPTLSLATDSALAVSTHCNTTFHGTLPAYDPEGDELRIEVVSYPNSGLLYLKDASSGEYTYTPYENAAGKDSFTYVARDKYGNYSAAATVSLTIVKPSSASVSFADMKDSPYASAAITLSEMGIMSGTQVGNSTYFYPDNTVSRCEFTVLAMNTLGISSVPDESCQVFADSADIPEEARGYVGAAYKLGYIKGIPSDGKLLFEPDRPITKAEAAVMLANMIGASLPTASIPPSFGDAEDIPTWAAPSMCSLSYMGVLQTTNGNILPLADLTRGVTAQMLAEVAETTT